MLIKIPKGWEIPEREVTPEGIYLNRRRFLTNAAAVAIAGGIGSILPSWAEGNTAGGASRLLKAPRNPEFKVDRPITSERVATGYNNYYEFTEIKDQVPKLAADFQSRPWRIEIKGLVEKRQKVDVDELIGHMKLEERVYRHRCVEAW
jgi:sulfoxide reductase catalytic subunit YedY